MPALNARDPDSRRSRVLRWYQTHPGFHRCIDVARALGEDTQPVAVASRNLMLRGDIERHHADPVKPGGRQITLYGINPATAPPTPETDTKRKARQ